GVGERLLAQLGGDTGAHQPHRRGVVHHWRHAALVVHLDADPAQRGDVGHHTAHVLLGIGPGSVVEHADRAAEHTLGRNDIGWRACLDRAPDQREAGPDVDLAGEEGRHVRRDARQSVDEVDGQLGTRGVPTWTGDVDLDQIARRGDGPRAQTDLADRQPWIAVQREGSFDAVQLTGRDDLARAAHDLFGRLED